MSRVRWDRVGRSGLLVVLTIVAVLYVQHTVSFFSTRSQAERAQATVQRLIAANARLARQQKSLSDHGTITAEARQLGMVKVGERSYTVSGLPKH